jgi:hypothetical protein
MSCQSWNMLPKTRPRHQDHRAEPITGGTTITWRCRSTSRRCCNFHFLILRRPLLAQHTGSNQESRTRFLPPPSLFLVAPCFMFYKSADYIWSHEISSSSSASSSSRRHFSFQVSRDVGHIPTLFKVMHSTAEP